jgi:hypothetical protein
MSVEQLNISIIRISIIFVVSYFLYLGFSSTKLIDKLKKFLIKLKKDHK